MKRSGEMVALGAIAVLVAVGGRQLLVTLGQNKTLGALVAVALVVLALRELRGAFDPAQSETRIEVTKAGAYMCAATLALWAILAPARWVFGSCIVAAEVAIVFDLITLAARPRLSGGS